MAIIIIIDIVEDVIIVTVVIITVVIVELIMALTVINLQEEIKDSSNIIIAVKPMVEIDYVGWISLVVTTIIIIIKEEEVVSITFFSMLNI